MTQMKYPPCKIGLFSEKPRRHEFEIMQGKDGKALTRLKNGVLHYRASCKYCGLRDPKEPTF